MRHQFFFFVFFCVLSFASMTERLTDVYVCIDCYAKWLKCYSVLLHWYNEMDDFFFFCFFVFTSEIQNHCPETGQCGLLMYINEICSMVVFWSWFLIDLNRISRISEAVDVSRSQMCGFVWSRSPLWGGAHWPVSHGEPASLVQSFSC